MVLCYSSLSWVVVLALWLQPEDNGTSPADETTMFKVMLSTKEEVLHFPGAGQAFDQALDTGGVVGVCGGVWVVAMEWRVSGGDPQLFRFICFYSSLYSRVFPRS